MVFTEKSLRSVRFALVLLLLLSVMLTASVSGAHADNDVAINETNFPDEAFRAYVAANFDKDGNERLSEAEIAAVQTIDLSSSADCINNTGTLQGIGVFTSLRQLKAPNMKKLDGVLDLSSNSLLENVELRTNMPAAGATESLDGLILGNQPNLTRLVLTNRWDLTELDLSGCPALVEANLDGCKLSSLDVSHNQNLLSLTCAFTNLADIDLSQNPQLMALSFHHCENMTFLSLAGLSNLHQLTVQYTPISVLDISGCPYLLALLQNEDYYTDMGDRHLYETNNGNMADRLFFSKTTTLLTGGDIAIDSATFPDAAFRQYVSDTFDGNGDDFLSAEEIELVDSIDLANTDCIANTTTLQGIGVFTNLRELKAPNMKKLGGVLSLANNTLLESVGMRTDMPAADASESLEGIILGNKPNLTDLVLTNRWKLTAVDLSGCPALLTLNLDGCALSALDLSNNNNLLLLSCAFTDLTELDLSRNRQLLSLNFHHNTELSALSLAGLADLHQLTVQYTPIPVLDISGCPYLLALLQNEDYHTDLGDRHLYETNNGNMADRLFFSKTTLLQTEAGQVFTTLTLPASLDTIGEGAFEGVAADIVEVPEGCTSIGSRAFADCPRLKLIYVPAGASVEDDTFAESDNVYVSRYGVVYE